MPYSARLDEEGRLIMPAECRVAAGLEPGDELLVDSPADGELHVRTRGRALREAQAIVAKYVPKGRDLVQELIEDRRAEAARE